MGKPRQYFAKYSPANKNKINLPIICNYRPNPIFILTISFVSLSSLNLLQTGHGNLVPLMKSKWMSILF